MTTQHELLAEIGRHPLISVRQLCRMLDISKSWVYERLGEASDMVGKVNPRHPDVRSRALYYLTARGTEHLGLPNRQGDSHLLLRIATAYQVRDFFLSLQSAGLPVTASQAVLSGTLGRSVDGVACLEGERQLIVEWDRGERPLGLYPERLKWVAGLASHIGAGLLVVPADGFRGAVLSIILGDHLDTSLQHLAVARRRPAAEGSVRATICYVPGARSAVSLGCFLDTLPTAKRTLLASIPAVKSYPREWPRSLRCYTELSPLQKEMLCLLAGLSPLTPEELATICRHGGSVAWIRRSLVDLRRRGLTAEYVDHPGFLRRYYTITCAGISFLLSCSGSAPRAYARARHWALTRSVRSGAVLDAALDGTEEVRKTALALARKARRRGQIISWYDGREVGVVWRRGGAAPELAPAAAIQWENDVILIDADCGRFRSATPGERLEAFNDLRRRPELRFFGQRLRLLVVTSEKSRRDAQWLRQVSHLGRKRDDAPLDILVTTARELRERGANAPIWRGVGDRSRRAELLG